MQAEKIILLCAGSAAMSIVLTWSIVGGAGLQMAAMAVAIVYFVVSMAKPHIAFVAGIDMFIGTIADEPAIAMVGAMLALPFAVIDSNR